MSGVATQIEIEGLVNVGQALGRLSRLDLVALADVASEFLVNSTQARLQEEKASPEGEPWAPWSPAYAKTRVPGVQSLLISKDELRDSIANYADGPTVRIGSNLVYAAFHQFGSDDGDIPARPYLGVSEADRIEIEQMALDLFGEALS